MSKSLWIGNIEPGTSEAEVIEFVKKYAHELECKGVKHMEGDGSRPAMVLQFPDAGFGELERLQLRLNGIYWKGRQLFVTVTQRTV